MTLHHQDITVNVCLYLQISWEEAHICRAPDNNYLQVLQIYVSIMLKLQHFTGIATVQYNNIDFELQINTNKSLTVLLIT